MPLLDHITDVVARIGPRSSKKSSIPILGGGHGIVPFEDDNLIVSRPAIIFHSFQIFFNFLAMACFATVAGFQAKWGVGPSGLSGFALFVSVAGMLLSTFMLMTPVIYEKYDKLVRAARALKEVRVAFIFTGAGVSFSLLISFITAISAWTEPGCKNSDNDPHAKEKGDDFKNALPGWCNTKKAGSIFFWLTFVFWAASLALLIYDWRTGKLNAPRDPTFVPPQMTDDDDAYDEESTHAPMPTLNRQSSTVTPMPASARNDNAVGSPFADSRQYDPATSYSGNPAVSNAGRPSLDVYGAFSDPAPSGFINPTNAPYNSSSFPTSPPRSNAAPLAPPDPDLGPRVSRTMQYADPYAAVRASLAGQGNPPSYESYPGYT